MKRASPATHPCPTLGRCVAGRRWAYRLSAAPVGATRCWAGGGRAGPASPCRPGFRLQAGLSETAFTADLFVAAVDAFSLGLTQPTVLVLDNAASHRAVLVRQHHAGWAARGLRLVFLPPYAPELNRLEIRWPFCKHYGLPPAAYRSAQPFLLRKIGTPHYRITFG